MEGFVANNKQGRVYLEKETAEQIVRSLDDARFNALRSAGTESLLRLCSVAQWIVHLPQFVEIHRELKLWEGGE
jgi:hypothetical protein